MNDPKRAIDLAVDAHTGQTDRADETYIRYPLHVMEEMETETKRVVVVLHDVVEDTNHTLKDIERTFGSDVRAAIDALTKREEESYMEFVDGATENPIARTLNPADIEDSIDLTRLDDVNESVLEKQETYHEVWIRL